MLARGLWVVLVVAPGCTARGGPSMTTPDGHGAAVVEGAAATRGTPEHAELERRAKDEQRALDERLDEQSPPMYEMLPEAREREKEARKHAKEEHERLLELEAKARRAQERSRVEGTAGQ